MQIQSLQSRRLLADFASLSATGTLLVEGTGSDDQIIVGPFDDTLVVERNAELMTFAADYIKRIYIDGGGGDDRIENFTKRRSTLLGNDGTDTLIGGNGDDRLDPGGDAEGIVRPRDGQDVVVQTDDFKPALIDYLQGRLFPEFFLQSDGNVASITTRYSKVTIESPPGGANLNVRLTDSNDLVSINETGNVEVETGYIDVDFANGHDILKELSYSGGFIRVNAGAGDDKLLHQLLSETGGAGGVELNGGPGRDHLDLYENYGGSGGPGYDTVEYHVPGEQTELSLLDNFERFRVHAFNAIRVTDTPGNVGHLIDVRNVVGGATVLAGEGNDTVVGSLTNDVLSGGPGDDTIDYTPRDHAMNIAIQFADNDGAIETSRMLSSFGGVQERDELRDFEAVLGSQGNDTILAGGHDGFSVRVDGSGGDDFLTVAEERFGAPPPTPDAATLVGGSGNDSIEIGVTNATIEAYGGRGDDTIRRTTPLRNGAGGTGTVVAVGGSGVDRLERIGIELSDGTMMIPLETEVWMPREWSAVVGSSGSETILLVPEDGLQPAAAFRTVDGGSGDDLIDASAIVTSVLRITGGNGNDTLFGGGGRDFLVGRGGDDSIVGGVANDTIIAGAGDDQLFGGRSDDSLDGGEGNDTIDGGEGNDRIPTGPGIDRLRLRDGEADTIFGTDDEDELLLDEFDETLPTPP